jgi:hypothetical protein
MFSKKAGEFPKLPGCAVRPFRQAVFAVEYPDAPSADFQVQGNLLIPEASSAAVA